MRSLTNIRRMIFGVVIICFLGSSAFGAPRRYIISGFVQTSGGSGVEGVSVVGDNRAGSAVTDADGAYSITVPNNWGGTITVSKAGWLITPPSKTYSRIRENKANENYTAYQPKISGNVFSNEGLAISGATISASGGFSAISDSDGYYELMVPYGWNGSINVTATGYYFGYTTYLGTVVSDRPNVNFTGFRPKISGSVKDAAGFYLHDVVITADNGGGSKIAILGSYEIFVPYGWSGTLTASLTGYGFTEKSYTNVTTNQVNQNFTGYQPKISGYVRKADGTALSSATVSASGAASTTTNASGYYEIIVSYGWSGTVTASKAGYSFTAKSYTNVITDQPGQDFTGYQPKISGYVLDGSGAGVAAVSITANNGGGSAATDASGYYEIIVPYNWSGMVTAKRAGWQIIPEYYSYNNLTVHQSNQDFTAVYVGIIVKPDGTGDFATIQAAIDAAANGDVVVLQPGTYTGTGNRDIDFLGKAITVRGATGDPNDCVIDCQGTFSSPHQGFKFVSGEGANSVLQGLTITNGYAPIENYNSCGGGIYCSRYNSSPTILNCIITGNFAANDGGGIYNYHSNPTIDRCNITNNSSSHFGGGISNNNSSPLITNCNIYDNISDASGAGVSNVVSSNPIISDCNIKNNSAAACGGGIYNYVCSPEISNCTINGNSASWGGGIFNRSSSPRVTNCIIKNNAANNEGGAISNWYGSPIIRNCTIIYNLTGFRFGGIINHDSSPTISNCIVWGNQQEQINLGSGSPSVTYCNVQGGYVGVGNIDADPLFADDGYHLTGSSPCIDAGDPNTIIEPNETDIDKDPRIHIEIDIGVDEFVSDSETLMRISQSNFDFPAPGKSSGMQEQQLIIENYGIGTLDWQIQMPNDCNWLSVSPTAGSITDNNSTVEIAVDPSIAGYGTHSCQLQVTAADAENSPLVVTVNLEVLGPQIGVNNDYFYFTAYWKSDTSVAGQELIITNTGFDTLNWHIEVFDCNWLSVFPTTGQVNAGESSNAEITVNPNISGYGIHSCQLQVTAADAENSPLVVTVNLEVLEPQIGVNNDYFYFTAYGKSDDVAGQELIITNTGFDTLNWHIEIPDCNWLSVAPQSGQVTDGSSVVAISVDPTKVPAYGYNYATINIIDENASNSPQAVTVRLRVFGPSIYVNPYELYIYAERNTKVERTFEIINTGYDILHWNIETPNDCNWLEIVEPLSGECAAKESDIVTVTVDANGLEENDDYRTRLLIHSPECNSRTFNLNLIVYTSNEIHVPQDYPTIQEAVNAASTGDIIIVHPGKYAGFDVDKPALTIRSIEPENPAVVAATIIESGGYVFGNEIVINGLSFIYNPAVPNQSENGIYISKSSDMQIKNCRVLNFPGAGICVSERNPTGTISISNCVISNNGYLGWGWYFYPGGIIISGSANIENCLITGNFGGGILVVGPWELGGCKIYIRNNTIADNFSDITKTSGRGITCGYYYYYYLGLTLSLQNSITSNAVGPNDVEIFIIAEDNPDPNNINLDVAYSNIRGGLAAVSTPIGANVVWGQGNIDADPCFVEPGYWVDANDPNIIVDLNAVWVDGDYHLKSEGWRWDAQRKIWKWDDVTSRCIDAGNPGSPLGQELLSVPDDLNNEWGENLRINMGAYGGTAEASMPPYDWAILADLTNDGKVGLNDLAAFVDYWPDSGECIPSDLNRNQFVDFVDFALFAQDWFLETSWYRP